MRGYLNKQEKLTVQVIAAFTSYLDDVVKTLEGLNKPPKDAIKWGKMARSFALKLLDEYFKPLDAAERAKVVKEVGRMEIAARYKTEALREFEAMKQLDSVTPMETDDLLQLAELALASCSVCDARGDDVSSCRFRLVLIKYDIEALNLSPGDGCPYRIGG